MGLLRAGEAALLLLFAYAGFENTAAPAGEFKNPRRDVPFALIAQIVIVTVIYSAVQWIALGTLPGVARSETPLADAARTLLDAGFVVVCSGGGGIPVTRSADGGLVIGTCNGFQILCEAHLLPGVLIRNKTLSFICERVHVRVENAATPFTRASASSPITRRPRSAPATTAR